MCPVFCITFRMCQLANTTWFYIRFINNNRYDNISCVCIVYITRSNRNIILAVRTVRKLYAFHSIGNTNYFSLWSRRAFFRFFFPDKIHIFSIFSKTMWILSGLKIARGNAVVQNVYDLAYNCFPRKPVVIFVLDFYGHSFLNCFRTFIFFN